MLFISNLNSCLLFWTAVSAFQPPCFCHWNNTAVSHVCAFMSLLLSVVLWALLPELKRMMMLTNMLWQISWFDWLTDIGLLSMSLTGDICSLFETLLRSRSSHPIYIDLRLPVIDSFLLNSSSNYAPSCSALDMATFCRKPHNFYSPHDTVWHYTYRRPLINSSI